MSDTMKIIVGIVGAVVALAGVAAAGYFVVKKVMSKYDCCDECILDCCDCDCDCDEEDDEEVVEEIGEAADEIVDED